MPNRLSKDSMAYKNKQAYIKKYTKENTWVFPMRFNKLTEADLIEFVKSLPNKHGFFKDYIRSQMKK